METTAYVSFSIDGANSTNRQEVMGRIEAMMRQACATFIVAGPVAPGEEGPRWFATVDHFTVSFDRYQVDTSA